MDLSKIEGLTESQSAAITAILNNETEGLRNKNEELIGEKRGMQTAVADNERLLAEARTASTKLAEEKLLAEGKYTEALELREKQNAELTAAANAATEKAKSALDNYHKGNALNSSLDLIHSDYKDLAKAQLSSMLKISYNDQEQPVTTYEHEGKVVANNIDEFKGWASEQPQFKRILNGVDSSGADTTQSRSSASNDGNTVQSKLAQRLKQSGLT